MTQKQLKTDQRGRVAEKIMEWGSLVFAGLVIAQAFSLQFDYARALVGAAVFAGAYLVADRIMRGGEG